MLEACTVDAVEGVAECRLLAKDLPAQTDLSLSFFRADFFCLVGQTYELSLPEASFAECVDADAAETCNGTASLWSVSVGGQLATYMAAYTPGTVRCDFVDSAGNVEESVDAEWLFIAGEASVGRLNCGSDVQAAAVKALHLVNDRDEIIIAVPLTDTCSEPDPSGGSDLSGEDEDGAGDDPKSNTRFITVVAAAVGGALLFGCLCTVCLSGCCRRKTSNRHEHQQKSLGQSLGGDDGPYRAAVRGEGRSAPQPPPSRIFQAAAASKRMFGLGGDKNDELAVVSQPYLHGSESYDHGEYDYDQQHTSASYPLEPMPLGEGLSPPPIDANLFQRDPRADTRDSWTAQNPFHGRV